MARPAERAALAPHAGRLRVRSARSALACGAIAAVLAVAAAAHAAKIDVPKPLGYVSDFAQVIDPPARARLDALIRELKQKTGSEIAVVTVKTTAPDDAFDYAMAIAESWKPGDPGKDNGVVFLVAVDDRKMHILTGYGVEGALPDGKVGEIRDRVVVPAFRSGDFSGGIERATAALADAIAREYGVTLSGAPPARAAAPRRGGGWSIGFFLLILFVILVLRALGSGGGASGFGRGRRRWPLIIGPVPGSGWGGGGFGGFSGGGGGGFGGFGGGRFGGGGAGGSW
ncbi:MAG TPA: TPM domain-containing protein [Candidatus Binatia bacterium]|nr:TPM domain-containing protein [Candidatus Binatia bacterium]